MSKQIKIYADDTKPRKGHFVNTRGAEIMRITNVEHLGADQYLVDVEPCDYGMDDGDDGKPVFLPCQ